MQDFHAINQTPVIEYLRLNVSLLKQYTRGYTQMIHLLEINRYNFYLLNKYVIKSH